MFHRAQLLSCVNCWSQGIRSSAGAVAYDFSLKKGASVRSTLVDKFRLGIWGWHIFSSASSSLVEQKWNGKCDCNVGPPNDSIQLVYNLVNSMVYGGYNELVNGFINQQT